MSIRQEQVPDRLHIFSLNCWGLKFISKHRRQRLAEIGAQLATHSPKPDIVGLQECWTQEDYQSIRDQTKHILPYGKYYHSGIFGGGLVILSRWPIEESNMVRYPLNGRPTAFYRGDWFVGKGVACARIRIGPSQKDIVEVFCTHLHAPYEREPHDSYICHRTAQAWEIAKLMRGAVERGHLVVGLGDFNMVPLSLAHRIVETHGLVKDVWRLHHPDSSLGAAKHPAEKLRKKAMPNIQFNLTENGVTCDSALNTWRWAKSRQKQLSKGQDIQVDMNAKDPRGKRLDYIFAGDGAGINSRKWRVDNVQVGMTQRHPTLNCSLSDHYSVEATLSCNNIHQEGSSEASQSDIEQGPAYDTILKPAVSPHDIPNSTSVKPLPSTTYDEILVMIEKYTTRERKQRTLRLSHFGISFVISIGCLVAVWWSPRNFVSFILMILSTLGLSAGVLDGLIGGLFVGSEIRALKEFGWEISNARELELPSHAPVDSSISLSGI